MSYVFTQLSMISILFYLCPRKIKFNSLLSHIADAIDVVKEQAL